LADINEGGERAACYRDTVAKRPSKFDIHRKAAGLPAALSFSDPDEASRYFRTKKNRPNFSGRL